jgi:hypothetical protein
MAPLPLLKVNKTLFEQIRLQFEKNPHCAQQQVADVMFRCAIQLNVELDGNKWITALVQSLCLRKVLFSKNTLMCCLRTYAREVVKVEKEKGWQAVSVRKIWKKQIAKPILGKVPFRPVPYRIINLYKSKVIHAMENGDPRKSLLEAADEAIEMFDYPPYSLIFDEWFEYKDGKDENPLYYH